MQVVGRLAPLELFPPLFWLEQEIVIVFHDGLCAFIVMNRE